MCKERRLMRYRNLFPSRSRNGFTLIELLAVVMVIGLLAGIVLGISGYASRKADVAKAKGDLERIRNALESYYVTFGHYPPDKGFLTSLPSFPRVKPVVYAFVVTNIEEYAKNPSANVSTNQILDPWGQPYYYSNISVHAYRVWSYGPDRLSSNPTNRLDDVN